MSAIGWNLTRSSTAAVTLSVANGATANFPTSFFTATAYLSDVTVTTLGTGVITIATTGWYKLTCSTVATSKTATGLSAMQVAFPWAYGINGGQASGPITSGDSATVHLNAGDTVQPMVSACDLPLTSTGNQSTANQVAGVAFGCDSVRGFANFLGRLVEV